jgi:hypothetical protein
MKLEEVKNFLERLNQENISFDPHFYKRSRERPITESIVRSFLSNLEKLEQIEKGNNERIKLWFKMSNKYSLVLIIEIPNQKGLKVISAWNTSRKWQKQLRQ